MKSTETQEQEQYGINANVTDNKNSGELIEQIEVEGTPFKMVGTEHHGYFVALGPYRLTETAGKKEIKEFAEKLEKQDWNFLVAVIGAVTQQTVNTIKGGE